MARRTSFSTSCKEGLIAPDSQFFFIGEDICFVFILKGILLYVRIVVDIFLSFNTLPMSSCCLLASVVSLEKSGFNLPGLPSCMMSHFSLATFKLFILFSAFSLLTMICLSVNHFEFIFFEVH